MSMAGGQTDDNHLSKLRADLMLHGKTACMKPDVCVTDPQLEDAFATSSLFLQVCLSVTCVHMT